MLKANQSKEEEEILQVMKLKKINTKKFYTTSNQNSQE